MSPPNLLPSSSSSADKKTPEAAPIKEITAQESDKEKSAEPAPPDDRDQAKLELKRKMMALANERRLKGLKKQKKNKHIDLCYC